MTNTQVKLISSYINTPIGQMLAIASEEYLYILEFTDKPKLISEINKLTSFLGAEIIPGTNHIIKIVQQELKAYFEGTLKEFTVPIKLIGTDFKKLVWEELLRIPYGETRSYSQQSTNMSMPKSFRAVANANGANQLAVIVPCHRVIHNNGTIGGYSCGIEKKKWLLNHEKRHSESLKI